MQCIALQSCIRSDAYQTFLEYKFQSIYIVSRWNDIFMVYCSSAKLNKFALTVHEKEYETSPSRSVCLLGQYVLDPRTPQLNRSFFLTGGNKALRYMDRSYDDEL